MRNEERKKTKESTDETWTNECGRMALQGGGMRRKRIDRLAEVWTNK
jgi:hypothetical protein